MGKIAFIGAGSTIFAKNVLGDCMMTESLQDFDIALYDIDAVRLAESKAMVETINVACNSGRAKIFAFCGVENRRKALANADFVVTAIQVGGYDPCTITDFEVPKKFGLRQTIGDTLGIGGIFRTLRTLPVFESIARDMEDVCPNALLLNYVNPMAMITGFMQRYTNVKTVGLCHSVQLCVSMLLKDLNIENDGANGQIAGINHMAWLLSVKDKNGVDLYPEIKKRIHNLHEKHNDMVRYEYVKRLGYYCTESSEHNAEYNPFFIKSAFPELIEKFNIPLDEYPRRCVEQIKTWNENSGKILAENSITHVRSREYASHICDAVVRNVPYAFGGNVINHGLIGNLPQHACVEVPCLVDAQGVQPCHVGDLPLQLAAMNMTNIMPQLLTIEAHVTKRREHIYHAAMLDPHTAAELPIDKIVAMCDDLIETHGDWLPKYQ